MDQAFLFCIILWAYFFIVPWYLDKKFGEKGLKVGFISYLILMILFAAINPKFAKGLLEDNDNNYRRYRKR